MTEWISIYSPRRKNYRTSGSIAVHSAISASFKTAGSYLKKRRTMVHMPSFGMQVKRPRINIFKLGNAYYFKYFFADIELFRKLESFYEKAYYRFRMPTAGERNKVMKLLDTRGYDPMLIEDPAPFTVEISKGKKYGELLKNSIENYPMQDKIVLIMKDMAWVEQAVAMGAVVRALSKN